MDKILREGGFEFDFSKAYNAIKFDKDRKPAMTDCLKAVDFLIEWEDEIWLVEVKEPDEINDKIYNKILYQGKDGFLHLYLNDKLDDRSLKYFVFIESKKFTSNDRSKWIGRLKIDLCLHRKKLFKIKYFDSVIVYNEISWNRKFPDRCPVTRIA
jgi:hypothetical protein